MRQAPRSRPPHERRALELRVVDELPYDDVARSLRIRPAAARLRVSRALRASPPRRRTEKLLSIAAQHPGAPVVRDAAAYQALERRLFPNG